MLSRYIGFYDKNKNKIHDNALLSEELSNIDLKQPKSNWEKLLKQAKDLGAKKVIVKFESQYPYFRVKYNIRFEPSVDIDGYDTPFNETLHDAFFLSYICDYLIIDNELKDSELTFLNWKEKHLSGLKYKGEDILLGNKYVVENLKEKYIPESLRGKELKLDMEIKLKTRNEGDFYVLSELKYIKKDGCYLKNKELYNDIDEDDSWMNKDFEIFIPPHADHLFKFLTEVFKEHED